MACEVRIEVLPGVPVLFTDQDAQIQIHVTGSEVVAWLTMQIGGFIIAKDRRTIEVLTKFATEHMGMACRADRIGHFISGSWSLSAEFTPPKTFVVRLCLSHALAPSYVGGTLDVVYGLSFQWAVPRNPVPFRSWVPIRLLAERAAVSRVAAVQQDPGAVSCVVGERTSLEGPCQCAPFRGASNEVRVVNDPLADLEIPLFATVGEDFVITCVSRGGFGLVVLRLFAEEFFPASGLVARKKLGEVGRSMVGVRMCRLRLLVPRLACADFSTELVKVRHFVEIVLGATQIEQPVQLFPPAFAEEPSRVCV